MSDPARNNRQCVDLTYVLLPIVTDESRLGVGFEQAFEFLLVLHSLW